MTWIKICGITNLDDALAAAEAGANAVGFVFYKKSPRHVTIETARSIIAKLPAKLEKVGVFVNEPVDAVRDCVKQAGLTSVQLSGDEDVAFSRALFDKLSNGKVRPTIFRAWPAKVFDVPAGRIRQMGSRSRWPGRKRRSLQRQARPQNPRRRKWRPLPRNPRFPSRHCLWSSARFLNR